MKHITHTSCILCLRSLSILVPLSLLILVVFADAPQGLLFVGLSILIATQVFEKRVIANPRKSDTLLNRPLPLVAILCSALTITALLPVWYFGLVGWAFMGLKLMGWNASWPPGWSQLVLPMSILPEAVTPLMLPACISCAFIAPIVTPVILSLWWHPYREAIQDGQNANRFSWKHRNVFWVSFVLLGFLVSYAVVPAMVIHRAATMRVPYQDRFGAFISAAVASKYAEQQDALIDVYMANLGPNDQSIFWAHRKTRELETRLFKAPEIIEVSISTPKMGYTLEAKSTIPYKKLKRTTEERLPDRKTVRRWITIFRTAGGDELALIYGIGNFNGQEVQFELWIAPREPLGP